MPGMRRMQEMGEAASLRAAQRVEPAWEELAERLAATPEREGWSAGQGTPYHRAALVARRVSPVEQAHTELEERAGPMPVAGAGPMERCSREPGPGALAWQETPCQQSASAG